MMPSKLRPAPARVLAGAVVLAGLLVIAGLRPASAQKSGELTWSKFSDRKPSVIAFSPDFAADRIALFGNSNKDLERGIWRTTDGGETWVKSDAGIPANKEINVYTIVFSPDFAADQTVYASVNKQRMTLREAPGALFRSTDGGLSWAEVAMTGFPARGMRPQQDLVSLSLSPGYADDGTMFAIASAVGIFRSTDRGSTWKQLLVENAAEVLVAPTYAEERLVAAATNGSGILFSTDGGESWAARNAGIEGVRNFRRVVFSSRFATDRTMLALSSSQGLFITRDAGGRWESLVRLPSNDQMLFLANTPDFAESGFLAYALRTSNVLLSVDLGREWQDTGASGVMGGQMEGLFMPPDYGTSRILYAVSVFGGLYRYLPVEAGSELAVAATAAAVRATATAAAIPTVLAEEQRYKEEVLSETGCITYYIAPPFLLGVFILSQRQQRRRRQEGRPWPDRMR